MSGGWLGARAALVAVGVLVAMVFGVSAASAATLKVCESGPPKCAYSSIQAAINAANSGDTIQIAPGTYDGHVEVPGSGSATSLTLQGPRARKTRTITGNGTIMSDVKILGPGETVAISGVTLTGGGQSTATEGGGIFVYESTVTLTNSTVSGNAGFFGGGIFTVRSAVTLNNSTVSGNSTDGDEGGGILSEEGTLTLNNSKAQRQRSLRWRWHLQRTRHGDAEQQHGQRQRRDVRRLHRRLRRRHLQRWHADVEPQQGHGQQIHRGRRHPQRRYVDAERKQGQGQRRRRPLQRGRRDR